MPDSIERRHFTRKPGPFQGSWKSSATNSECWMNDLSPTGAFIGGSTSTTKSGEAIIVTVEFEGTRFSVPAEVVYTGSTGFGVRFLKSEGRLSLAYAMGIPPDPEVA